MSSFLKSTLLTNRDATPKVLTDGFLAGGQSVNTIGSVQTGTSDSAGSYYRLISVPSNARVETIKWQSAVLSNSCILDLAVWYPTTIPTGGANFIPAACSGIIISSSIFATNLNAGGPAVAITEITNNSGNYTIGLQETPLWNVLGFASDPEIYFDMGFSVRVATGAAGYVGLKATYQY